MPRFFFNIYDGIDSIDRDGTELASWREAQREAIRVAGAIISESSAKLKVNESWNMVVTDEAGVVLFRLEFFVGQSSAVSRDSYDGKDGAAAAGT